MSYTDCKLSFTISKQRISATLEHSASPYMSMIFLSFCLPFWSIHPIILSVLYFFSYWNILVRIGLDMWNAMVCPLKKIMLAWSQFLFNLFREKRECYLCSAAFFLNIIQVDYKQVFWTLTFSLWSFYQVNIIPAFVD